MFNRIRALVEVARPIAALVFHNVSDAFEAAARGERLRDGEKCPSCNALVPRGEMADDGENAMCVRCREKQYLANTITKMRRKADDQTAAVATANKRAAETKQVATDLMVEIARRVAEITGRERMCDPPDYMTVGAGILTDLKSPTAVPAAWERTTTGPEVVPPASGSVGARVIQFTTTAEAEAARLERWPIECVVCGAKPGRGCRGAKSKQTRTHAHRTRDIAALVNLTNF